MENRELWLRAALEDIAGHARCPREDFVAHGDDLAYVRDLLSPDGNDACVKMGRLAKGLLAFAPGEIADVWLTEWHSESMRLVEAIRERYPEVDSLHHTWNAQKSLYDLLTVRYQEFDDPNDFHEEIKVKLRCLKTKYRENSNGFNALLVEQRRNASDTVPRKPSRSRTADPEVARRRAETRQVLDAVCDQYERQGKAGRPVSYLKVVRQMKAGSYAARMNGKTAETWANQASAHGKSRKGAAEPLNASGEPINEPLNTTHEPLNPVGEPLHERIVRLLEAHPGAQLADLTAAACASRATVKRTVAALIASGRIEHRGSKKTGGYWCIQNLKTSYGLHVSYNSAHSTQRPFSHPCEIDR